MISGITDIPGQILTRYVGKVTVSACCSHWVGLKGGWV